MATRGQLRASDADREQVAERLRKATAEGRLTTDELDERLGVALSARTYRELDVLVADLPAKRRRPSSAVRVRPGLAVATGLATVAVLALVALVVTGVLAAWGTWLLFAWFFFGRRRWCYARSRRHLAARPHHRVGAGHYWA